jgi:hypothetical protein
MKGGYYGAFRTLLGIHLRRYGGPTYSGGTGGILDPMFDFAGWPRSPIDGKTLEDILRRTGPGILLCVRVEQGVTVQEVVDFMAMCERLDQPWTFYFETFGEEEISEDK